MPELHSLRDPNTSQPRSILLAVVSIGLAILVEGIIVGTRGRFAELISDLDIRLSPVTPFALGPVLPILLATAVALTVAKELNPRFRSIADAWNGSVVCLALACLALYLIGVFAPLMTLIKSLS